MPEKINVLVIEDEKLATDHLEKLLKRSQYRINIIDKIDSVKNSIIWFVKNTQPDLIFMDIDLGDGLCFEIFEVVDIHTPVIFTTAYDEYAIKAFKVNSIDYLLKPIDLNELEHALDKFKKLSGNEQGYFERISNAGQLLISDYKKRFVVKIGEHLKTVPVGDIGFFFSRNKGTYANTKDGRNYLLDYTLENLDEIIDPDNFFRINRKYLISYEAIKDIISYSNSRLRIILAGSDDNDVIVSRDRVQKFKSWLDR